MKDKLQSFLDQFRSFAIAAAPAVGETTSQAMVEATEELKAEIEADSWRDEIEQDLTAIERDLTTIEVSVVSKPEFDDAINLLRSEIETIDRT